MIGLDRRNSSTSLAFDSKNLKNDLPWKKPGRKPGDDYGVIAYRYPPPPEQIDEAE